MKAIQRRLLRGPPFLCPMLRENLIRLAVVDFLASTTRPWAHDPMPNLPVCSWWKLDAHRPPGRTKATHLYYRSPGQRSHGGGPERSNRAASWASQEDERGNRGNTTGKNLSWARPPASRSDALRARRSRLTAESTSFPPEYRPEHVELHVDPFAGLWPRGRSKCLYDKML